MADAYKPPTGAGRQLGSYPASPPLPGLSSMLQHKFPAQDDAFALSPRPQPPVRATTPSTGSEASSMDLEARQKAASSLAAALAPAKPAKTSRYLREMDRRAILSRIAQGEKQSALAKEYHVSRAAICNLNKHRDEVLSRKDGNPLAKHPKKPRPKTLKSQFKLGKSSWAAAMALRESDAKEQQRGVHEIQSRAAALLLTTLRKKHATVSEFRRASERLMRIVMEEALAHVPVKTVEIFLPNHAKSNGVALEHPPCAVSMEPVGCPMLDLFQLLEPEQPTAYVAFGDAAEAPGSSPVRAQVKIFDNRMPASLNYHNVFLVDHVVTSPDLVGAVVRRLQERGAVEAMISLVALMATQEAVDTLHAAFPALKIVVAQVDSGSDELAAPSPVGFEDDRMRASTTDMILDRLEQVYHGFAPNHAY
jgi:uracil phosphoribosyltransferase